MEVPGLILPQRGIAILGVCVCVCACVCVCVCMGVGVGQGPKTFREPPGAHPPPTCRPPGAAHPASVEAQDRPVAVAKAQ